MYVQLIGLTAGYREEEEEVLPNYYASKVNLGPAHWRLMAPGAARNAIRGTRGTQLLYMNAC